MTPDSEGREELFGDLPRPECGRLTLYLLGSGFGESQIVVFPDRRILVMDCCMDGAVNLTSELLAHVGTEVIDLLVVSHAHADHVTGVDSLFEQYEIRKIWSYPRGLRDLVAHVQEIRGVDAQRLASLRRAQEAIHAAIEAGTEVHQAGVDSLHWPVTESRYRVTSIAPTTADRLAAETEIARRISATRNPAVKAELCEGFARELLGEATPHDDANRLSIALSIEWEGLRIVLGGDVLTGSGASRGWRGVLRRLEADGRLGLVRDPAMVKVSHHGSRGSYCEALWAEHSRSGWVPLSAVTPYDRGASNPPHGEVLAALREHCRSLVVTSPKGDSQDRALEAGWHLVPGNEDGKPKLRRTSSSAPIVAVAFEGGMIEAVHVGQPAELFHVRGN